MILWWMEQIIKKKCEDVDDNDNDDGTKHKHTDKTRKILQVFII